MLQHSPISAEISIHALLAESDATTPLNIDGGY